MQAIRINILLFFAVAMFVAKPFIGFGVSQLINNDTEASILIKSFTKRKQEFVENSDFDVIAVQKRLAGPVLIMFLSPFFSLSKFFNLVFNQGKTITGKVMADIYFQLFPPGNLYLLNGKLSI